MKASRWTVGALAVVVVGGLASCASILGLSSDVTFPSDGGVDAGVEGGGGCVPSDANAVDGAIVFVTSTAHVIPDFSNGPASADGICQTEATEAGLCGRTFMAWLSYTTSTPESRMNSAYAGDFVLPDGTVVAHGWLGFSFQDTSKHLSVINETAGGAYAAAKATGFDPYGACLDGGELGVWTGTGTDGTPAFYYCSGWVTDSDAGFGEMGRHDAVDQTWTSWCAASCNVSAPFYCIELPR